MSPPPQPEDAAGHPVIRTGIDLVGVARVARLLAEHPNSVQELFTAGEYAYCAGKRRRDEHLAGRFAAKEAVLKAFGTGMSQRLRWTDVEIVNEPRGRPTVRLHGAVAALAQRRGLADIDVSLSHSAEFALANVVTVWRTGGKAPPGGRGVACDST